MVSLRSLSTLAGILSCLLQQCTAQVTACTQTCCLYYNPLLGAVSCACSDQNTCYTVNGQLVYSCYDPSYGQTCVGQATPMEGGDQAAKALRDLMDKKSAEVKKKSAAVLSLPKFTLQLSATPSVFAPFIPVLGAVEEVDVRSVTWIATPRWNPTLGQPLLASATTGQVAVTAAKLFDVAPAGTAPNLNIIDVTGTVNFFVGGVGSEVVTLTGSIQPAEPEGMSCLRWLVEFSYDDSGTLTWTNGQVGNGPLNPAQYFC